MRRCSVIDPNRRSAQGGYVRVVLLDTETTGFLEPVVPVQVAMIEILGDDPRCLGVGETWYRQFNPKKEIEYGAMSTHFVSNEMAQDYQDWDPSLLPEVDLFVGHSIDYDWKAVGSPANVRRACTFAMAKRAWPELDSHKLGAILIKLLGPDVAFPMLQSAHQAKTDALNNLELVRALSKEWDIASWEEFWEINEMCRMPTHMQFGKYGPDKSKGYAGLPLEEMVKKDRGYTDWVLKLDDLDPYLRKAIENAREG
jgi:exodeoxyribonuclease X